MGMRKVYSVGMGNPVEARPWVNRLTTYTARSTNQDVCGTINSTASPGEVQLMTTGVDPGRSIYACISDGQESPTLYHSRGRENRTFRPPRQTAVTLTKSRSFAKKLAMITRSLLTGRRNSWFLLPSVSRLETVRENNLRQT